MKNKVSNFIAMFIGLAVFMIVYGCDVLNPAFGAWLMQKGDLMQHYLGWRFYRKSEWLFPFGLTDNLAYPDYSSVIYTDSIPLFAVLFKMLSPILPDTFQYFGIWGAVSFMLQGLFAVNILKECSVGKIQAYIGSILFILSPVVIEKMFYHTALGGHWIILAAIYMFVRHKKDYDNIKMTSACWGMIGVLVAGIHMYYLPMCGAVLCGYVLCSLIMGKKAKVKYLMPGITFLTGLLGNTFLLGGFYGKVQTGGGELGYFSFNLNGFFNAQGYSKIFHRLELYTDGQYEGFSYLGLGMILLLIMSLIYVSVGCVCRSFKLSRDFLIYAFIYLMISIGLVILAASPYISLNDKLIFEIPYSSTLFHYWSIFRSSGRLIWPVYYFVFVGVIVLNARFWGKYNKTAVPAVIVVIAVSAQIWDMSDKLIDTHNGYSAKNEYSYGFGSDVWDAIADRQDFEHVIWVSDDFEAWDILPIAKFACDNDLTLNNFYFARGMDVKENTKKSMENLSDDCVYVFLPDQTEGIEKYGLNLYEADGYIIGTTVALGG